MRSRDALVTAALLSLTLVVAPYRLVAGNPLEGTPSVTAAADEVNAANQQFWRAFSARDLWAMGRLWARTESISAVFPADATVFLGWENIRESFRRSFAHNRDIRIDPRVVTIRAEGTIAWLVEAVRFEAVQTQTGQPIVMDRMLSTKLFERSGDTWRLIHFHAHFPGFVVPNPTQHRAMEQEPGDQPPTDDVARVSAAFYNAFADHDLEAMAQAWAKDDAVSAIHPSNPAPFLGPKKVMASWAQAFSEIEAMHILPRFAIQRVSGSVAWVVDMNAFHALLAKSPAPRSTECSLQPCKPVMHLHNVLSTQIFEKREGQWLMVHYHGQIGFSFDHAN